MDIHIVSPNNALTFEELRRRNYPFNRTFVLTLDSFVRLSERTGLRPQELIGYIRTELIPVGGAIYTHDDVSIDYRLRLPNEDVPDAVLAFFDPKTLRSQLNMSRKAFATLFIQMILDVSPYVGYSLMALMYRMSQMDGRPSVSLTSQVALPVQQPVQPLTNQVAPFAKSKKRKRKEESDSRKTPVNRETPIDDDDEDVTPPVPRRRRTRQTDAEPPVRFKLQSSHTSTTASDSVATSEQPVSEVTSESELESSKVLREQKERMRAMGLLPEDEQPTESVTEPVDEKPVVKTSNLLNQFL